MCDFKCFSLNVEGNLAGFLKLLYYVHKDFRRYKHEKTTEAVAVVSLVGVEVDHLELMHGWSMVGETVLALGQEDL
ncbi:unnamed protein product [Strongylus vulgaris]|uniref:Uncharacterized protein n=1 Tax=Strongylus vulgaris TaxID=40348 RepID=A0A3P7HZR9_STRVU|nr:unnamed protein product [Strongylus vulgaris]